MGESFARFIPYPVRRVDLEYPTVDVSLVYLTIIGKTMYGKLYDQRGSAVVTVDTFADRAVEVIGSDESPRCINRWVDSSNWYELLQYSPNATADLRIVKIVSGTFTDLASEAVDLGGSDHWLIKLSVLGSTLKAYRDDMTTPKITATDTSLASGRFGVGHWGRNVMSFAQLWSWLRAPSSPSPKPIAYFETPVIGSGTPEDPFRAQMPEQIVDDTNVLALTNSALIKTGKDGKPVEYRAIVRIFDQPDRSPNLAPITQALDALKAMKGVRKLDRETAIREAKRLDDKLHDLDLRSARELGKDKRQAMKEYKEWRVYSLGVKEEVIEDEISERYVEEDKGW